LARPVPLPAVLGVLTGIIAGLMEPLMMASVTSFNDLVSLLRKADR